MASKKNNSLNISLGVDLENLKKGFVDAIKTVKGSTGAIEQEAKDMANALVASMKKIESASTLKQASRQLDNMVGQMRAFGLQGTAAFGEVVHKAGQMKAEIDDVSGLIKASRPDAPFQALTTTLTAAAQGFAGLQGAMALFGGESEDVQKILLKVQAALAIAEGAKAIDGLVDGFQQVSLVVKMQVIPSLVTLRGALIATGIGAFVVTAGILASKLSEVADEAKEVADKTKSIMEAIEDFNKPFDMEIKKRIATLKGFEDTEDDIFELEQQGYKNRIANLNKLAQSEERSAAEKESLYKEVNDLYDQMDLHRLEFQAATRVKERADFKKNLEEQKKLREQYAKEHENDLGPQQDTSQLTATKNLHGEINQELSEEAYNAEVLARMNREVNGTYIDNAVSIAKANEALKQHLAAQSAVIISAEQLTSFIQNSLNATISDMAFALGEAAATGQNVAEALGQTFLAAMSGFLKQFGQMLVAAGIAKMSLEKLAIPGGSAGAIAAGVALIAIAGAIQGSLSKGVQAKGFASGGVIGGTSFSGDRLLAPVNSGEVVLNKGQQNEILRIANGGGGGGNLMAKVNRTDFLVWMDDSRRDNGR